MRIITRIRAFSHTLETNIEANFYRRQEEMASLKASSPGATKRFEGSYSAEGFKQFSDKNQNIQFKQLNFEPSLSVSPIGVGTYHGSFDETDDLPMFNGIIDSVLLGCNVIDTCRNFRKGRSEAVIGLALRHLFEKEKYNRSNFFLSSKAGYVF
jgi:hypothetical protein